MRAPIAVEVFLAIAFFVWGKVTADKASTPTEAMEAGTLYLVAGFMLAATGATLLAQMVAGRAL